MFHTNMKHIQAFPVWFSLYCHCLSFFFFFCTSLNADTQKKSLKPQTENRNFLLSQEPEMPRSKHLIKSQLKLENNPSNTLDLINIITNPLKTAHLQSCFQFYKKLFENKMLPACYFNIQFVQLTIFTLIISWENIIIQVWKMIVLFQIKINAFCVIHITGRSKAIIIDSQ